MPVYNAAPFLRTAIGSILNQTFGDFEFLIINDASTDDSAAILASYTDPRLRVVHNDRNLGQTATLNRGLRLARAELVARQDADDVSLPRRLHAQMAFLHNHPDIILLGTRGTCINGAGEVLAPMGSPATDGISIRWSLCFENPFIHTSVIFRRDFVLTDLGGYDPSFSYCQDFDLWSKLARTNPIANLPDQLVLYRTHSASMTATMHATAPLERKRVYMTNLAAIFPERRLNTTDLELLTGLHRGVPRSESTALLRLLGALLADYLAAHPEALVTPSFRETVGLQYFRLAALFARQRDPMTLIAAGQAVRWSPRTTLATAIRALARRSRRVVPPVHMGDTTPEHVLGAHDAPL